MGLGLLLGAVSVSVIVGWPRGSDGEAPAPAIPIVAARLKATFPHDPASFTQGLAFRDGLFYEGTGGYGFSRLRVIEPATGRVLREQALEPQYFGEGIEVVGDRIYQLTWKQRTGFIYETESLRPIGSFRLPGEGWGLTYDGTHLILSDGSAKLSFLDPNDNFKVVGSVRVMADGRPVSRLNELEMVGGEVWANVWYQDYLVRIDPKTGQVVGYVDLRGLRPAAVQHNREAILNGIAYEAATGRLFVTGKLWPVIYELDVPGL